MGEVEKTKGEVRGPEGRRGDRVVRTKEESRKRDGRGRKTLQEDL